jgi:hypothetical protein
LSGFLGIGGKNSKQQNESIGNLGNLFNFGMDTGKQAIASGNKTTAAGLSGLGDANSYFKNLASGNRTTMMQSVAPEVNAVQNQTDAARRQAAASGTARGGGTAGANQTAKDSAMAQIDNLLFGARPAAAKEEAATSGKIADVGTQQTGMGTYELQTAGGAASSAGGIATNAREQQMKATQQIIKDVFGWGGNSV